MRATCNQVHVSEISRSHLKVSRISIFLLCWTTSECSGRHATLSPRDFPIELNHRKHSVMKGDRLPKCTSCRLSHHTALEDLTGWRRGPDRRMRRGQYAAGRHTVWNRAQRSGACPTILSLHVMVCAALPSGEDGIAANRVPQIHVSCVTQAVTQVSKPA